MPSDRGNGLAMRTGFLLDAYAKRFEIDLAVVPVAGGTKELTPFVEMRVRRATVLPVVAPVHTFALVSEHQPTQRRGLRRFGNMRAPFNHRQAERRAGARASGLCG